MRYDRRMHGLLTAHPYVTAFLAMFVGCGLGQLVRSRRGDAGETTGAGSFSTSGGGTMLLVVIAAGAGIAWATTRIDGSLAGVAPELRFMVHAERPRALLDPLLLRRIAALQRFLEEHPGVVETRSLADLVRERQRAMQAGRSSSAGIPDDAAVVERYLEELPAAARDGLVGEDLRTAAVKVEHRFTSSAALRELVPRASEYAENRFAPAARVEASGELLDRAREVDKATLDLLLATVALLAASVFDEVVEARSLRGLSAVLPSVAAGVAVVALVGLAGVGLSPVEATLAAFAAGLFLPVPSLDWSKSGDDAAGGQSKA